MSFDQQIKHSGLFFFWPRRPAVKHRYCYPIWPFVSHYEAVLPSPEIWASKVQRSEREHSETFHGLIIKHLDGYWIWQCKQLIFLYY
jgi:hypothetical protein